MQLPLERAFYEDQFTSEFPIQQFASQLESSNIPRTSPLNHAALHGPEAAAASWLGRFIERAKEFEQLSRDWNSYGANPPNRHAINAAIDVLKTLSDVAVKPVRIAPSVEEGIIIYTSIDNVRANIECFNTGEILAAIILPGERPFVWELTSRQPYELRDELETFVKAAEAGPTDEDVPVGSDG